MKKLKFALCSLLVLCSCFVLAACAPVEGAEDHTHDYKIKYTIENGKAYINEVCMCKEAKAGAKTELSNYVIVSNTQEAQTALDNAAEGVTIVLNSGNYSNLYLRKNATSQSVASNWAGGANYTFLRKINGLSIVGVDDVAVTSINAEANMYSPNGSAHSQQSTMPYVNLYLEINNLVVRNIKFTPAEGKVAVQLANSGNKVSIDGLTIDGCTVNGTNSTISGGNRLFNSDAQEATEYKDANGVKIFDGLRKNITITNCVLNDLHQGFKMNYVENLTVVGNDFNNIKGRDMLIGGGNGEISGTITITNNTFDNSTERVCRMNGLVGDLIVKDNVVTNYNGADPDMFKVVSKTGATFDFANNYWAGLNDVEAKAEGKILY